ncbi:beta-ketoacyl-ACP synthase I [Candidatus Parcubacteria bacterium]|nr:beta-ketoacyl-ACP synthase I [Candidatus Parcubacteria bacterium]
MRDRRVVITGMGIISSIGNSVQEVTDSLFNGKSGIIFCPEYKKAGMASQVVGKLIDPFTIINKRASKFMSKGAGFAYLAMTQAINQSCLEKSNVSNPRTGAFIGTGGGSPCEAVLIADTVRDNGLKKLSTRFVVKTMPSSAIANISTLFGIKGISFSLASACATSAHCIGEAFEKIVLGKQDIMFAGGVDETDWVIACAFDRMRALSAKHNDKPQKASRPYDKNRNGFVMAGGGGIIVLEELKHALNRNAKILAEIVGYGATSDGDDMTRPSEEGGERCMKQALETANMRPVDINYINTHGTSTPAGDIVELQSIKKVFEKNVPFISSTKSLTGHGLGAAGVHEIIYSIIMMRKKFLSASHNIETLDPDVKNLDLPILRKRQDNFSPKVILSNSFGFGGSNATLIIKRYSS